MGRRMASTRYLRVLFALTALLGSRELLSSQTIAPTDAQVQEKASSLLRQMTLDEKVAQLSQLPGFPTKEWKANMGDRSFEEIVRTIGAGSVLWVPDPKRRPMRGRSPRIGTLE